MICRDKFFWPGPGSALVHFHRLRAGLMCQKCMGNAVPETSERGRSVNLKGSNVTMWHCL